MRTTSGAWETLQIEVKCEQYEVSTCPHSRKDMIFCLVPSPQEVCLVTGAQMDNFHTFAVIQLSLSVE